MTGHCNYRAVMFCQTHFMHPTISEKCTSYSCTRRFWTSIHRSYKWVQNLVPTTYVGMRGIGSCPCLHSGTHTQSHFHIFPMDILQNTEYWSSTLSLYVPAASRIFLDNCIHPKAARVCPKRFQAEKGCGNHAYNIVWHKVSLEATICE